MTSPEPPADAWIAALRSSHDRLRAVAERLTPEQVRQRGYPAEWSIAQVLSHVGSGAEINMMLFDANLVGEEAPPRESNSAVWDRWNSKSPDEQAADALKADALLVEKVEANAGTAATFHLWSGPTGIGGFAASRLSEHAVHTWDVAVAVDPSATILPDAVALLVDQLPPLLRFAAKPSGWTGVVHVSTSGPAREFALRLGETSTVEPWSGGAAAGRLELPAEALVRLAYGRLDPDHTPASVRADGIDLADLRAVFQGF